MFALHSTTATVGAPTSEAPGPWSRQALAGRLVEVRGHRALRPPGSAGACLSAFADLLRRLQHEGEPAAWIGPGASTFFPPDLADAGIDLDGLVVVRVADDTAAARAADRLLRSGAFGLVALDLQADRPPALPLLGRLLGLARRHAATVLLLRSAGRRGQQVAPAPVPLASLRVCASFRSLGQDRFALRIEALEDKRHGPGWTREEVLRGPDGLR